MEKVTAFEEIYSQAVVLNALQQDDTVLQRVLYQGLLSDIKHMAAYKNDVIDDYDKFKIELQKIEADLIVTDGKQCHAITADKKPLEMEEVNEMKGLTGWRNNKVR